MFVWTGALSLLVFGAVLLGYGLGGAKQRLTDEEFGAVKQAYNRIGDDLFSTSNEEDIEMLTLVRIGLERLLYRQGRSL